ncbi:hypothetical protein BCU68_11625 [Vibrio sp. 10N.286.49.B3]|uniref:porin family protein n=1 Tax=Vibrio sp. 10N.286.49.B3 TaxID=1880855 RepID=UPI000C82F046|nr:porin family protein [Vibrio sp. 10N.286.49.B3]PMH44794.1 hypothetical protein BCU68_11625 [Vibrio sp. 10N.286.49.B3]
MSIKYITFVALSFIPIFSFANDFHGQHRIGIGYSNTENPDWLSNSDSGWGDGVRLEYGYDFNHVFGINLSYSTNKSNRRIENTESKIDGYNFKIDTDIGQKFDLDGYAIKPYGILGLARQSEKNVYSINSDTRHESFKDMSFILGVGVRADIGNHIYSDFRLDFSNYENTDYSTISWSIGYRL